MRLNLSISFLLRRRKEAYKIALISLVILAVLTAAVLVSGGLLG